MKPLFKCLAVGIACASLGLSLECAAATPSLGEFGYGNMTTKRAIYNAIILVNFTNNNGNTPLTVPFRMGTNQVHTNYAAAERYYSNWFFGRTTSPESMNGYFHEISNGRFQWLPAPVCMVLMDTNHLYRTFWDHYDGTNGAAADHDYMTHMIGQAMAQGFDLRSYDLASKGGNGNGTVTPLECTIQLIGNDLTFGGGARDWSGTAGVDYDGWVTIQHFDLGLRVLAEELIHVLQSGPPGDIYGPSGMSSGFTVMSGGNVLHVDAWHKLQFAWCEPRRYSLRQAGLLILPAAQRMDVNGPVILYDLTNTARGSKEFFVLEYRTTNTSSLGSGYDKDVKDSGLVIWHVQQDGNKHPVNYTTTYFPSAETNWRRCMFCRSLFITNRTDWPCSRSNTNHVAENAGDDKHLRLPCNDPNAGGVPGWRSCQKCGQLFYFPNLTSSACPAGGRHQAGVCEVSLRHNDDPEALGTRKWQHCSQCQSLFRPREDAHGNPTDYGACAGANGGVHAAGGNTNFYTLLWADGVNAMMTEGSPNFWRSRGDAWHGGDGTPGLRWFDGTSSATRILVHPFAPGADEITVEIQPDFETWVDFRYGGTEDGSFARPFNTFAEGVNAVFPQGNLHIKTGTSPERGHVGKPLTIEAYGGPVTIGR
ncbi:MAG: hypothetical protein HZA90_21555 [Verrucomicrobia bacterium]|nr:hypothetical protein [Verrucomicrobiota bacterium]